MFQDQSISVRERLSSMLSMPENLARCESFEEAQRLVECLTSIKFIGLKIDAQGVQALIGDYDRALSLNVLITQAQMESLRLIRESLQLSETVLEDARSVTSEDLKEDNKIRNCIEQNYDLLTQISSQFIGRLSKSVEPDKDQILSLDSYSSLSSNIINYVSLFYSITLSLIISPVFVIVIFRRLAIELFKSRRRKIGKKILHDIFADTSNLFLHIRRFFDDPINLVVYIILTLIRLIKFIASPNISKVKEYTVDSEVNIPIVNQHDNPEIKRLINTSYSHLKKRFREKVKVAPLTGSLLKSSSTNLIRAIQNSEILVPTYEFSKESNIEDFVICHQNSESHIVIFASGSRLAQFSLSTDNSNKFRRNIDCFKDRIRILEILSTEKICAVVGDSQIIVCDLVNRKNRLIKNNIGQHKVVSLCPIPYSNKVVVGTFNGNLIILDSDSGVVLDRFNLHTKSINDIKFSENYGCIISASSDNNIKILNLSSKSVKILTGHQGGVQSIAVNKNRIVSAASDSQIMIWDIESGKVLCQTRDIHSHKNLVNDVALSRCGTKVASVSHDLTLKFWRIHEGIDYVNLSCLHTESANGCPYDRVEFTDDGKQLVSLASWKKRDCLQVWDTSNIYSDSTYGSILWTEKNVTTSHLLQVNSVDLDSRRKLAVSGSDDNSIIVWDALRKNALRQFRCSDPIVRVKLHPTMDHLVSVNEEGYIETWYLFSECPLLKEFPRVFDNPNNLLEISRDGNVLVTKKHNNSLLVFDYNTCKQIGNEIYIDSIVDFIILPDSKRILSLQYYSYSGSEIIRIWDLYSGEMLDALPFYVTGYADKFSISRDFKRIAISHDKNKISIFDLNSNKLIQMFEGHYATISSIEFLPNLRYLLSSSSDNTIRVWDIDQAQESSRLSVDTSIYCCSIDSKGELVVAGDYQGSVHFLGIFC